MRQFLLGRLTLLSLLTIWTASGAAQGAAATTNLATLEASLPHVTPQNWDPLACTKGHDSHSAINSALASGKVVELPAQGRCDIGVAGVIAPAGVSYLVGNGAVLTYRGNGNAIGAALIAGTIYPTIFVSHLTVQTTAAGATCFDFKFSSSVWDSPSCMNLASNSTGLLWDTDIANGTGPYYNLILNYSYSGKVGIIRGVSNNRPIDSTSGTGAACGRAPNANTMMGSGNISDFDLPVRIRGEGNLFKATLQNIAAGGTVILLDNPSCPTGTTNINNTIESGTYIETATANVTGISISSTVLGTLIGNILQSGTTTAVADASASTYYTNGHIGECTASLAASGGGAPSYAGSGQECTFSLNGDLVTVQLTVATTALNALSGNLMITGLPYRAGALGSNASWGGYVVQMSGVTLDTGFSQVSGRVDPSSNAIALSEVGNSGTAPLTAATLANAMILQMVVIYRRN